MNDGESNENLKVRKKLETQFDFKLATVILMVWRAVDRWQDDAGMQHDGAVVV